MLYKIPKQKVEKVLDYRAYYDKDTGEIYGISNKPLLKYDTFILIKPEEALGFLEATKRTLDYKVTYDINNSRYQLIHKKEKIILDVNDLVHHIVKQNEYQILFVKDNVNNCWKIEIDKEIREQLIDQSNLVDESLWFSITQKNNPNILYRQIELNVGDLVRAGSISFKFESQIEEKMQSYSVYTIRRFKTYSKGEINE
jgi:hypothetical protein